MTCQGERIREKKSELDALRPLSPQTLAVLHAWYDVELTFTSNALEGNTLTRNETALVMEKGITVSGKPLKDHLEASAHGEALLYVRELAGSEKPVSELAIRNIHRPVHGAALMNLLLLKRGYPPVVIRPKDRLEYFDALDAARSGDRAGYHQFMNVRLEEALNHNLQILRRGVSGEQR